jgi:hypothetical protein
MLARRTLLIAVFVMATFVTFPVRSSAQLPDPFVCPRQTLETDFDWTNRCFNEQQQVDTARRVKDAELRTAATARQRATLEKQPPLAAEKNRLLGRWETSTRPAAGGGGDPFAQLAGMLTGCGVLLGDGIVEFAPDRWAIYDHDGRNDMGAISYRAGANGAVFGLPARGSIFELLPFEFDSPNQVHLVGVVCTLKRTTATTPAGRGAGSSQRGAAATPSATASAPQGAAPAARPARSPLNRFNGKMGYDCPDGQADVSADTCTGETDTDTCVVVRVNEPLKNGVPATFTETIGAFKKRVASCKMRPTMFLDKDRIEFAP